MRNRSALPFIFVLTILLLVTVQAVSPNDSLTEMEIKADPTSLEMQLGDRAFLNITIIIIHSRCPLEIDDTEIILPEFLSLADQTEWQNPEKDVFNKTLTVEAIGEGSGYIRIIRDCPRYGLLEKLVPVLVGDGVLPGEVDKGPPEFKWSLIGNMTLNEVAQYYGLEVFDVMSALGLENVEGLTAYQIKQIYKISNNELRNTLEGLYEENRENPAKGRDIELSLCQKDYVFFLLLFISFSLFLIKSYNARYITLLFALIYFGFYQKGCMCHIGAIGNLFLYNIGTFKLHWLILVIVPILFSLFFGRVFCGWVCLFGSVQQFIYDFRRRTFPKMRRYDPPRYLHLAKLPALLLVIYYAHMFSRQIFCEYDPFLYIFTISFSLDFLGILTILLLVFSFFIERPFCRFACPLGALLWVAEKLPLYRVKADKEKCNSCGLCKRVCPMNKDIPNNKGECICCGACMIKCQKGLIRYGLSLDTKWHKDRISRRK
jgi:ferredoxin